MGSSLDYPYHRVVDLAFFWAQGGGSQDAASRALLYKLWGPLTQRLEVLQQMRFLPEMKISHSTLPPHNEGVKGLMSLVITS